MLGASCAAPLGAAVLIIIYLMYSAAVLREELLEGFYVSTTDFECESGGEVMIYIGPGSGAFSVEHKCYIVVLDVCNQAFTLSYLRGPGRSCHVEFEKEQIWPAALTLDFAPAAGTLTFRDADTTYAACVKNNSALA